MAASIAAVRQGVTAGRMFRRVHAVHAMLRGRRGECERTAQRRKRQRNDEEIQRQPLESARHGDKGSADAG